MRSVNINKSQNKNKRRIVISDIHGCLEELNKLLALAKYNKDNDILIFLGDYIDRGDNSKGVIERVKQLQKESKNVIALKGNHEQMLVDYYRDIYGGNAYYNEWAYNGGYSTLESYDYKADDIMGVINWVSKLPLYCEDKDFIYVHAGLNPQKKLSEQNIDDLLWIREEFIYSCKKYEKCVIFGHTPSFTINNKNLPYKTNGGNVCIDTGCVFHGGKLTALIIQDGKIKKFYNV